MSKQQADEKFPPDESLCIDCEKPMEDAIDRVTYNQEKRCATCWLIHNAPKYGWDLPLGLVEITPDKVVEFLEDTLDKYHRDVVTIQGTSSHWIDISFPDESHWRLTPTLIKPGLHQTTQTEKGSS